MVTPGAGNKAVSTGAIVRSMWLRASEDEYDDRHRTFRDEGQTVVAFHPRASTRDGRRRVWPGIESSGVGFDDFVGHDSAQFLAEPVRLVDAGAGAGAGNGCGGTNGLAGKRRRFGDDDGDRDHDADTADDASNSEQELRRDHYGSSYRPRDDRRAGGDLCSFDGGTDDGLSSHLDGDDDYAAGDDGFAADDSRGCRLRESAREGLFGAVCCSPAGTSHVPRLWLARPRRRLWQGDRRGAQGVRERLPKVCVRRGDRRRRRRMDSTCQSAGEATRSVALACGPERIVVPELCGLRAIISTEGARTSVGHGQHAGSAAP